MDNNKQTYYVSVQANTVVEEQGAAAYEFEIEASEKEWMKLTTLFEEKEDAEKFTFVSTPLPALPYHVIDGANDEYDAVLKNVYQCIYELGTKETKDQINQMNII
ncbi:hypothetical protein [Longirhabdus pacifica]|uniref:hypothetical protein n=1 Tax=Longirhabdus pacifica TaxID=2305227 RepID=UPI001F0B81E2|nr:hypothetical protein [Longirhabdus pacifica]